jgi:hypothetical protein
VNRGAEVYFRIGIIVIFGFCAVSIAGPVPIGNFMTGPDSAVYLYWYHSGINAYEQGIDGTDVEWPFIAGDQAVGYHIAQNLPFPYLSALTDFNLKIHNGDLYPQFPGDQYSPFVYSIYDGSGDSMPGGPPLVCGTALLCGGEGCSQEWVVNSFWSPNPAGENRWFVLSWNRTTPTAPQIYSVFAAQGQPPALIGSGYTIDSCLWQSSNYAPLFRARFLSPFPCDTSPVGVWRRTLPNQPSPDSFLIIRYDGSGATDASVIAADTLIYRICKRNIDSARIVALTGSDVIDSGEVVRFDRGRTLPVSVHFETESGDYEYQSQDGIMTVENASGLSCSICLAYDQRYTKPAIDQFDLPAAGRTEIPIHFSRPMLADSIPSPIVLIERSGRFYPVLIWHAMESHQQTAADDLNGERKPPKAALTVLPNPSFGSVKFRIASIARRCTIEIFNILGQKVANIQGSAEKEIIWNGIGPDGRALAGGVYLARLADGIGSPVVTKIILCR